MSNLVPVGPGSDAQGERFRADDEVILRPGTWWQVRRRVESRAGIFAVGAYFLCIEVKYAHGSPHALTLAQPPGSVDEAQLSSKHFSPLSWKFLVDEFLHHFRPVTDEEALAARDAEIAALNSAVSDIQDEIKESQVAIHRITSENMTPAGLLSDPTLAQGSVAERRLAAISLQKQLSEKSAALVAASEAIDLANLRIQAKTRKLTLYYTERAQAIHAAVQPAIAVAKRLQEQVDTMGLYLGSDISAKLLVDGQSAPAKEKLHLWQRKLFMDEEILIHLLDGGADYSDLDTFAKMLASDETLVNRIFGAPRAVVIMAFRRNSKQRSLGEGSIGQIIARAFQNAADEAADKAAFMLVRDGGKIWFVTLPEFLTELPRMFPTPEDLEAPYKQRDWFSRQPSRTIGQDDIAYADSVEQFRLLALQYERLLLVLWGLHDRLNIFGPFVDDPKYKSFVDPQLQQERFQMIMDDQSLIGTGRPSFRDWFAEKNKFLKPGSSAIVIWRQFMTPETAPTVVKYPKRARNWDYDWMYEPDEMASVVTVRRDGAELYVEAPVSRTVYRYSDRAHLRSIKAKVSVQPQTILNDRNYGLLVLDDVDSSDLDFYLNSRTERENYIQYAAVMVQAREVLKEREREELPAFRAIMAAVQQSRRFSDQPAEALETAVRSSLRAWRLSRRGSVPDIGSSLWQEASKQLMRKIWFKLYGEGDPEIVDDAEALMSGQPGAIALRIVRDKAGCLVGYSIPDTNSVPTVSDKIGGWPYIRRYIFDVKPNQRIRASAVSDVIPYANVAGEDVVCVFDDEKNVSPFPFKFGQSPGALLSGLEVAETLLQLPNALLGEWALHDFNYKRLASGCYSEIRERVDIRNRCSLLMPVGYGALDNYTQNTKETPVRDFVVWCLVEDGVDFLARSSQEGRERAISVIKRVYTYPEVHISKLPKVGELPGLSIAGIPLKKSNLESLRSEIESAGYGLVASRSVCTPVFPIKSRFDFNADLSRAYKDRSYNRNPFNYFDPEVMRRVHRISLSVAPSPDGCVMRA